MVHVHWVRDTSGALVSFWSGHYPAVQVVSHQEGMASGVCDGDAVDVGFLPEKGLSGSVVCRCDLGMNVTAQSFLRQ